MATNAMQVVGAALRRVAEAAMTVQRLPGNVSADDAFASDTREALLLLRSLRDGLPPGALRAAAAGQIATLQRHPLPVSPAEILTWASDWEGAR